MGDQMQRSTRRYGVDLGNDTRHFLARCESRFARSLNRSAGVPAECNRQSLVFIANTKPQRARPTRRLCQRQCSASRENCRMRTGQARTRSIFEAMCHDDDGTVPVCRPVQTRSPSTGTAMQSGLCAHGIQSDNGHMPTLYTYSVFPPCRLPMTHL